tara:strand:+ start:186 stop:1028 length:843 start_codon:yes stop_codon:yes gene_type:complete
MRDQTELLDFVRGREEKSFILVTITETEGSTYLKKGTQKLIACDGTSAGLISGGCLESEIIEHALKMPGRTSSHLIDSTGELDRVFGYSVGCQGKLYLNFEKLKGSELYSEKYLRPKPQECLDVLVFGAGPDIDPLKELLDWTRWNVSFYTHRSDLFEERKSSNWVIDNIDPFNINLDIPCPERTAVLLMSHNYPSDLETLKYFLNYSIGYIGILGPSQKKEHMLKDLKSLYEIEVSNEMASKIYGPMGIKNLGRGGSAIALSIISQLQSLFFNNEGKEK